MYWPHVKHTHRLFTQKCLPTKYIRDKQSSHALGALAHPSPQKPYYAKWFLIKRQVATYCVFLKYLKYI